MGVGFRTWGGGSSLDRGSVSVGLLGGGSGGGSGTIFPSTLTDTFGQAIYVDALIRSRDATLDPGAASASRTPSARQPNPLYWDAWVRTYLGVHALLEPLRFVVDTASPQETRSVGLHHVEWATPPAGALTAVPVAKLTRPPQATFASQLPKVLDWADLRMDRASEIVTQIDNQYPFWGAVLPFHTGRMPRTLELVEIVIQFAVFVESRFKHEFVCDRPYDFSAQVQPMITTPGHSSFPCGHCTQGFAVAHVLATLLGLPPTDRDRLVQLQRIATRISMNRVVAGVHFPVDNLGGRLLGTTLGEYVIARCVSGKTWSPRFFDGTDPKLAHEDFDPLGGSQTLPSTTAAATPSYYKADGAAQSAGTGSELMESLWEGAYRECEHLR